MIADEVVNEIYVEAGTIRTDGVLTAFFEHARKYSMRTADLADTQSDPRSSAKSAA